MKYVYSPTLRAWKSFGLAALCLTFAIGCSTSQPSMSGEGQLEEIKEVEAGNDPEVQVANSGAPQDCIESDERPVCQIRPRGTEFFAVKIKNERFNRCLRPAGGSTRDNVEIILSTCANTKSRLWKKEFNNKDHSSNKTYRFVNENSGKCIKKTGTTLRQVTCAPSGLAPNGPEGFRFQQTPPFGSGDIIKSTNLTGGTGCMQAVNRTRVNLTTGSSCNNDPQRRWFQPLF